MQSMHLWTSSHVRELVSAWLLAEAVLPLNYKLISYGSMQHPCIQLT